MFRRAALCAAILLAIHINATATVPQLINYQGILTDPLGDPIIIATNVTFALWLTPTGGTALWIELHSVTPDADGRFTVILGSVNPIPDTALAGTDAWLGITVDTDPEMPRQQMISAPYSMRVRTVDGASGGNITSKVSIGPGHTNTGAHAFVAGEGNFASGSQSTVSGGFSNTATGSLSNVGGGLNNVVEGPYSTIGGGNENYASASSATVGGGETNQATGPESVVGGGVGNQSTGNASAIAGGSGNLADGFLSAIGGGESNHASGQRATVSGGGINEASGDYATVGGGTQNIATSTSTTVGGGEGNIASGPYATIAGGSSNRIEFPVVKSLGSEPVGGTIGGGLLNAIYADNATISGGIGNTADAFASVVPGGQGNVAGGDYSFAAGRRAKAIHSGTFVWADHENADFESTDTSQFLIRAREGVGINTASPEATLHVAGDLKVDGNIIGSTPWTPFPFAAGFNDYEPAHPGPGWQVAQYRKIGDVVQLRGFAHKADHTAINGIIGTLPVGFRPPARVIYSALSGPGFVQISAAGEVIVAAGANENQWLDGVAFSTTP